MYGDIYAKLAGQFLKLMIWLAAAVLLLLAAVLGLLTYVVLR